MVLDFWLPLRVSCEPGLIELPLSDTINVWAYAGKSLGCASSSNLLLSMRFPAPSAQFRSGLNRSRLGLIRRTGTCDFFFAEPLACALRCAEG